MLSELKNYLMGLWLLLFGVASAGEFSLRYLDDETYLLETPAAHDPGIVVYPDGSSALDIVTVHDVTCAGRSFHVPVIRGVIETGISTGERLEYFVLESVDGHQVPLKSFSSFKVLDRETGKVISQHILTSDTKNFISNLCRYIQNDGEHDSPLILANH